ncbi:MAG TPA: hypothetical protein PKD96_01900 [Candidatus Absconditabacterales bacterium]|nr:hypothetical protein [Candidatus Absconditabacterales bacterium]HMT27032.1 hypothetical protein [Candidatus Absconditabacterales bacterium]
MKDSRISARIRRRKKYRIHQGDIIRDVTVVSVKRKDKVIKANYPYLIVMTQDCDLEQDFDARKKIGGSQDAYLINILVCPAYSLETFQKGEHLTYGGTILKRQEFAGKGIDKVKHNREPRYYFLEGDVKMGIPDLVLDFKLFLTIDRMELYSHFNKHYVVSIEELFREYAMQKFANFLSRIGLPTFQKES